MRINFSYLSSLLIVIAATAGLNPAAIAQPASSTQPKPNETLAETFNRAFFGSDRDFFTNRSLRRQLDWIFGTNGFPENEIHRDSKRVHNLYQAALERQVSSDPPIRTRDLPNPYATSILTSPAIDINQGMQGNELLFEKQ